jgi:hypothetical protein
VLAANHVIAPPASIAATEGSAAPGIRERARPLLGGKIQGTFIVRPCQAEKKAGTHRITLGTAKAQPDTAGGAEHHQSALGD